ncbi:MAG: FAD:protein FMN transferase [Spirochaetes bacterium]|nr:FAD:protein FMN transferase [Spirochaetota bacterium]
MRNLISSLIVLLFLNLSCTKKSVNITVFQQVFFAFDTVITITIVDDSLDQPQFDRIIKGLKSEAKRFDLLFNIYNPKSELYRLSSLQPGLFYSIDKEVYGLLKKCRTFYDQTEGAFDITIGTITQLYNFEKGRIPSEKAIQDKLKNVGMENIIFSNGRIKLLKKKIRMDLGGVAKGYIIDKFSDFIRAKGFQNFFVNIGGDIYASGRNREGKRWVIGIQHPKISNMLIDKKRVSDQAIVTSGDYERFVLRKKKKYHHIIDPDTGRPVWNNIVSVTIIARDALVADYIATAVFVMGKEKAEAFIRKYYKGKIKYYIIIEKNGSLEIVS